jgi:hypothetical protein
MKNIILVIALAVTGVSISPTVMAATPGELVDQMLQSGFDANRANLICGKWSDAKSVMLQLAKSGEQGQIDLAHKIVSHRYSTWEKTWTSTVREMAEEGISKPIEGMAPTGSWKEPLTYQQSTSRADQVKFIIDGTNADIDATFFGKNPNVTEDFVERAAIKWAKTTGGLPDGSVDYNKVNEVLKNSEITPFPRHPDGKMSTSFKQKFPEIVRESYPGPQGQRALEQNYLLKSKDASIVRYNKAGQLVTEGNQAQIIRNQPAANLIEDINQAKFTRIERMQQLGADYQEKFVKKFTTNKLENQQNTAKMLQRMIEGESHIQGVKASHHKLYQKAINVKNALREGSEAALKKALEGQSLDNFLQEAKTEMSRINGTNQARLAGAADDAAAAAGLSPAMRGLMLLGYGTAGADAFLKARTGEGAKEIAKAVTASLAADLTASTIGPALGGAAARAFGGTAGTAVGVGTGFGAAIAAYMVTHAALEWTEAGINNMLGGYKVDASMKSIFLNRNTVEKFLTMTPEEIKKIVEREWDQQDQWGGAYLGKSGDSAEQLKRRQEIIFRALEAQNRINQSRLREKIVAEIIEDELARFAKNYSPEELAKAREKYKDDEKSLWEWAFGSPLDKLLEQRLNSDKYRHYKALLERLGEPPSGKPGLWERLFGEDRDKARQRADAIYNDLIKDQKALEELLAAFDRQLQIFNENLNNGVDVTEAYDLLASYVPDMQARLNLLGGLVAEYLKEHNLGYGGQDDLSAFYARKSDVTAMLLRLGKGVEDRKRAFEKIRLMSERFVILQKLKKLEQDIQALENRCKAEEGARKSAEEAWRLSQTIEASVSQILTEYEAVRDNTGTACSKLQELRAGIIESTNNAARWAISARVANEASTELLQSCPTDDPIDVENVSNAIKGAMLVAKKAAEEYTLAYEASEAFRSVQAGARDGIGKLGAIRNKLSDLEYQILASQNHIDIGNSGLEKMKDLGAACTESNKSKLSLEVIALATQYPWLDEFGIDSLQPRLGNLTPRSLSKTIANDIEKSQKTIDLAKSVIESGKIEELQGSLTKCDQAEPPTDKLLFAMEAMQEIKGSYNWLNDVAAARSSCLAKQKQLAGQVAEGKEPKGKIPPFIQQQLSKVDPGTTGYIKIPRPGECKEYDPTNPACEPGAGGSSVEGPTEEQIARAKKLGEQIEVQPGTQPDPRQKGEVIPETYTSPGEPEPQETGEAQPGQEKQETPTTELTEEEPSILGEGYLPPRPKTIVGSSAPPAGQRQAAKPPVSTKAQAGVAQQPAPVQSAAPSKSQTPKWVLVQTMTVPWDNPVYTQTLKKHTNYNFVFSGVMSPWPDQTDGMDAAYCYRKDTRQRGCARVDTHQYLKVDSGEYYGSFPFTARRAIPYNEQHVYEKKYVGHGKPAMVKFCCFYDTLFSRWAKKSGSLTLKIYEQRY